MITLYQFPISHYCEKVRWALDYKKIPYQTVNWIPGPHLFKAKKIAKKTSVPIIKDGEIVVQDSTNIINYLDQKYPTHALTPADEILRKEVLDWEEYCDAEIGVHLRRFFYHTLLQDRKLVTSMLLQNGPSYGRALYFFIFPVLRYFMRKTMRINAESAKRSEERLVSAIKKINLRVQNNKYLVGNSLTRADITAASLIAPLCMPPEHDFRWPSNIPEVIQNFLQQHGQKPFFNWVLNLYKTHRK